MYVSSGGKEVTASRDLWPYACCHGLMRAGGRNDHGVSDACGRAGRRFLCNDGAKL